MDINVATGERMHLHPYLECKKMDGCGRIADMEKTNRGFALEQAGHRRLLISVSINTNLG